MPMTGNEVNATRVGEWLRTWDHNALVTVWLEKVHSMPKQGVASTFTFGERFGKLKGTIEALYISYQLVTPQAWKKEVLAGTDWKSNKRASAEYVMRAHPDIDMTPGRRRVPHLGIADAVCIAEYGMRQKD